jgi:UDP-glucose 4-epimerase
MNVALLRYFNPIGAHPSGLIGEDPNGIPNNLVPYIAKVAVGTLEKVHVFGNDYPTPDGTGVRDYIHVVDLARGHVAALKKLASNCGLFICNLGTGRATARWTSSKHTASLRMDLPLCHSTPPPRRHCRMYADPAKAGTSGWTAEYGIEEMCASSWKWQSMNPNGYKG